MTPQELRDEIMLAMGYASTRNDDDAIRLKAIELTEKIENYCKALGVPKVEDEWLSDSEKWLKVNRDITKLQLEIEDLKTKGK